MSTVTIEESFELDAPPNEVWSYLVDPAKIVVCLPGAELTEVVDDRTYEGRVRVKVGAVTISYAGTMEFREIDHDAREVQMVGTGREKGGGGTASMTMTGTVEALEADRSRVHIRSDLRLTGRVVRFGRGMIGAVSKEVFAQFAGCLAGLFAVSPEVAAGGTGPASAAATEAAPDGATDADSDAATDPSRAPLGEPPPLSAFGLLWATLRSSVRRMLSRIFGGGS